MSDFDFQDSFFDWSISKVLDKILEIVNKNFKDLVVYNKLERSKALLLLDSKSLFPNFELQIDKDQILKHLDYRLSFAEEWSDTVLFKDLKESKKVQHVFVDLNLYLTVRRVHLGQMEELQIPVTEFLTKSSKNVILLGAPGAGKTTISKYVCAQLLQRSSAWAQRFAGPLVIRFRDIDYNSSDHNVDSLYLHILNYLGIRINAELVNAKGEKVGFETDNQNEKSVIKKNLAKKASSTYKQIICEVLDTLHMMIILDGFDEIPNVSSKSNYINEIQELIYTLSYSRLFITSRTGEFNFSISNAETYEIAELSDDQIDLFIEKWIGNEAKCNILKKQLRQSTYKDVARRPINIAHLCALFERYNEIPDKPKNVYRKIVRLMTDEWDEQRGIVRTSFRTEFGSSRKLDFLSNIAFLLTTKYNKLVFTRAQLEACFKKIYTSYSLEMSLMDIVINELESHHGLFLQCGFDGYEFCHKSIQEYLCAEYLVRMPLSSFDDMQLVNFPDILAVTASLSSEPNIFIGILILEHLSKILISYPFIKPFVQRLISEKPDFDDNPILALAIIFILRYNELLNAQNRNEAIIVTNLINTFIHSQNNIRKSFLKLSNYYLFEENDLTTIQENSQNMEDFGHSGITLTMKNNLKGLKYSVENIKIKVSWPIFKLIYGI